MKDDKKHLDIDLDFLDKKDAPKAKPPKDGDGSKGGSTSSEPLSTDPKYNWKNILIIGAIILFFGWVIFSGSSSDTSTNSYTPTTHTGNTLPPPALDTSAFESDTPTPTVPKVKTDSQICKADYGSHSYATGKKTATGGPECDCQTGYQWNSGQTACVAVPVAPKVQTPLEICQERNGYNATYDSATNSCGCASGYSLGTSNQCVSLTVARDQSCSAKFPGTSWLKNDPTDGHSICDCVAGSYWNNERTACYTLSAFTQSCVNSYGTGAMSTTENGKRVCDCGYGYDFNPQRNACVTTASINAICERDVGRNSRYSGSSSDGKYNCTEPY